MNISSSKAVLCLLTCCSAAHAISQTDTIIIEPAGEFEYSWTYSAYTSVFDKQGEPYVYTASMELGLVVFDISDIQNPLPVDTILPAQLNNLKLTNISQFNNYLFGSLGSFQGLTQNAGLVIFNVGDPQNVIIEDQWDSTAFTEGSAIAITDGQFAYLGAMSEGLIILNVSDVNHISYVSDILPDPNFPEIPGPFSIPNARGMALKNADTLILCYDAGGLRMIDVSDKFNPAEIGMYANASIESTAQSAYNNVVLIDNYAYVPVDYCGLDVVDISSPTMTNVNWINPWGCTTTNWDGCEGHTNQLVNVGDSLLFVSGGDSEILVYDISDKANPVLKGEHINILDMEVTWGIDVKQNLIATAMVDNPIGVPYDSDWGGIQLFEWNQSYLNQNTYQQNEISIFPIPSDDVVTLAGLIPQDEIMIHSLSGKLICRNTMSTNQAAFTLSSGVYLISVFRNGEQILIQKAVIY